MTLWPGMQCQGRHRQKCLPRMQTGCLRGTWGSSGLHRSAPPRPHPGSPGRPLQGRRLHAEWVRYQDLARKGQRSAYQQQGWARTGLPVVLTGCNLPVGGNPNEACHKEQEPRHSQPWNLNVIPLDLRGCRAVVQAHRGTGRASTCAPYSPKK